MSETGSVSERGTTSLTTPSSPSQHRGHHPLQSARHSTIEMEVPDLADLVCCACPRCPVRRVIDAEAKRAQECSDSEDPYLSDKDDEANHGIDPGRVPLDHVPGDEQGKESNDVQSHNAYVGGSNLSEEALGIKSTSLTGETERLRHPRGDPSGDVTDPINALSHSSGEGREGRGVYQTTIHSRGRHVTVRDRGMRQSSLPPVRDRGESRDGYSSSSEGIDMNDHGVSHSLLTGVTSRGMTRGASRPLDELALSPRNQSNAGQPGQIQGFGRGQRRRHWYGGQRTKPSHTHVSKVPNQHHHHSHPSDHHIHHNHPHPDHTYKQLSSLPHSSPSKATDMTNNRADPSMTHHHHHHRHPSHHPHHHHHTHPHQNPDRSPFHSSLVTPPTPHTLRSLAPKESAALSALVTALDAPCQDLQRLHRRTLSTSTTHPPSHLPSNPQPSMNPTTARPSLSRPISTQSGHGNEEIDLKLALTHIVALRHTLQALQVGRVY